jgi:hypothetical protein
MRVHNVDWFRDGELLIGKDEDGSGHSLLECRPPSRRFPEGTAWPLKMELIGTPEMSISNHLTQRNKPEDGRVRTEESYGKLQTEQSV